jgi:tRNA-dihydrouridine synthase
MNPQAGQKIYVAPFQGITTRVFREVFTHHFPGADKLFTAFFTGIHNAKSLRSKEKELEKISHNGVPVVPQILSKDGDEILLFGKLCHNLGFSEINWNLGCPFPRVARKMRGSGLLPYPGKVAEILESVLPTLPVKLSVKCRLGYQDADEIMALLPVFNNFPLSEIIVHARLGRQMYKGNVDTGTFKKVLQKTTHQMVYNGDIFSPEDFEAVRQQFPQVDRWMIGRGLLADPFLPGQLKGTGKPVQPLATIRKYVDDLYYAYRKDFNHSLRTINVMKEFWSYLSLSFDRPERVFGRIKKCTSFDAYEEAVNFALDNYIWQGNGLRHID